MELLLPAGSFQSGIYALKSGADAVYFGFKDFSARKKAGNFTFEEARKLKFYADQHGKKLYATFNTILREAEIPAFSAALDQAVTAGIDAVIVQDLGVLDYIRKTCPRIPIHASTQMAVHTVSGLRMLRKLGAVRAVLSRELTLPEITALHKAVPEIELEVFIHGALCFSFSGACLASGLLLGRSANRGECGQICRTWFSLDNPENMPIQTEFSSGYFFSMKDLALKEGVLRLQEAGAASLKIEGRMKSPEYTAEAAAFYRNLINRETADASRLQTIFSRSITRGWGGPLTRGWAGRQTEASEQAKPGIQPGFDTMIAADYPGHRGIPAAETVFVDPRRHFAQIRLLCPLELRDGLLILQPGKSEILLPEPVRFGVTRMENQAGKSLIKAEAGMVIRLALPVHVKAAEGTVIYKISAHDQTLPEITPGSIPAWKYPVDLQITIKSSSAAVSGTIPISNEPVSVTVPLAVESAESDSSASASISKIFSASGDSLFRTGSLAILNASGKPDNAIFIPLSHLKRLRRAWFSAADEHFTTAVNQRMREQLDPFSADAAADADSSAETESVQPLPARALIVPQLDAPVPFILNPDHYNEGNLPDINGTLYLPLNPILFDEDSYLRRFESLIERLQHGGQEHGHKLRIGLNNIGHIHWALELKQSRKYRDTEFFIDYYLYCANSRTLHLLRDELAIIRTGYYWLEDFSPDSFFTAGNLYPVNPGASPAAHPDTEVGSDKQKPFSPPLFISRSCFRNQSLGISCKGCPMSAGPYKLTQKEKNFTVYVKECITYLFPADSRC